MFNLFKNENTIIQESALARIEILKSIADSVKSLNLAMAYFTDKEIAELIVSKAKKGVECKIVLSEDTMNNSIKEILRQQCNVYIDYRNKGVMHDKFLIVDNSKVLHGTYNYTQSAHQSNSETLSINRNTKDVKSFNDKFELLVSNSTFLAPQQMSPIVLVTKEEPNSLSEFVDNLKSHLTALFIQFDEDEIEQEGFELAQDSQGSVNPFVNQLDAILSEAKSNLLLNKEQKSYVKAQMDATYRKALANIDESEESKLKYLEQHVEDERSAISQKISVKQEEKKSLNDQINQNKAEISKCDLEITSLTAEISDLDKSLNTRKFWRLPTVIQLFVLLLFFLPWLSLFFSSAMYKIFYEKELILSDLQMGVPIDEPQLVDINSFNKLSIIDGPLLGVFSILFFIIPLMLVSVKAWNPGNKWLNVLLGWIIGVFLIDFVVALLLDYNLHTIRTLKNPPGDGPWTLIGAISNPAFYLIFIFGAIPLMLSKLLIEQISKSYRQSDPYLVDKDKAHEKRLLTKRLNELELDKNAIILKNGPLDEKIVLINEAVSQFNDSKNELIDKFNESKLKIKEEFHQRRDSIKSIFQQYISNLESTNPSFLSDAIKGTVSAFKQGYFRFINSYFSVNLSEEKTSAINRAHDEWIIEHFGDETNM